MRGLTISERQGGPSPSRGVGGQLHFQNCNPIKAPILSPRITSPYYRNRSLRFHVSTDYFHYYNRSRTHDRTLRCHDHINKVTSSINKVNLFVYPLWSFPKNSNLPRYKNKIVYKLWFNRLLHMIVMYNNRLNSSVPGPLYFYKLLL